MIVSAVTNPAPSGRTVERRTRSRERLALIVPK